MKPLKVLRGGCDAYGKIKKTQKTPKIERGANMTLRSYSRVFRALGVTSASLDLGSVGKVALW